MILTNKEYPVFEANQVLTATHLNTMQDYLDEQNRLTRAALHGIGVVCGLEVSLAKTVGPAATLTISKGYGVTSEGYLGIVGNQDFVADKYQEFTVEDGYPLLSKDHKNKYPLWELLDANHDDYGDGKALTSALLAGKVVLLFVELLEKDLKNCSATSCDDMGLKVQVNIRKLLISETDLEKLNEEVAENTKKAKASGDFFPDLTARLGLPDIQLPRLDVPASNMVDGPSVFDAYRDILSPPIIIYSPNVKSLFTTVGEALDNCYGAFKPMLPALNWKFANKLKLIEDTYNSNRADTNVIFSQYFYDFLSDLIEAYDEFRWKAVEFMALCNPPQTLFPRHLELGETGDGNFAGQKVHRHYFRPSPALSDGKKMGEEVQQLFQRLRLLVEQFKAPSLPTKGTIDATVKITPSRLGDVALSDKSIPYYYSLSQALLSAWDFLKTRRGRADQNLGYNVSGSATALLSDLEHYNFFRIEGHLGFDWRDTLKNLLDKIRKYRLPFDVVALNAHPSTATADVLNDPLISHCLTNDLEIIYDAWTKELECLMRDKIKTLTGFRLKAAMASAPEKSLTVTANVATVARKINVVDAVVTEEGTFGKVLADALKTSSGSSMLKLKETFRASLLKEVPEMSRLSVSDYDLAIGQRLDTLAAMIEFSDALPDAASDLEYTSINNKYKNLIEIIDKYRGALSVYTPSGDKPVLTEAQKEAILGVLEDVLKNCLMERLEELGKELEERKKEVDELIFFSKYIQKHPGITHKAGVPSGGTFVLIFQETPTKVIEAKKASTYKIPERVVIADFFLPYRCCSDCPPVQFVMPAARPIFTMKQECADDKNFAWVNFDFTYRVPPCEVKVDDKEYVPLVDDRISLKVGTHVIIVRDAEGGVSLAQSFEVLPHFTVGTENPVCDEENKTYTVKLKLTNASLPITIDGKELTATPAGKNVYTVIAGPYKSGKTVTIAVGDGSDCPEEKLTLSHTCCDLPCNGVTKKAGYLFWLPQPEKDRSFKNYEAAASNFSFEYPAGTTITLTDEVSKILKVTANDLNNDFNAVVKNWIDQINKLVEENTDGKSGLVLTYEKSVTQGFLGTLWIEHYECLDFDFNIVTKFLIGGDKEKTLDVKYSTEKTSLQKDEIIVPAFDPVRKFNCETGQKPEQPCKEIDLKIDEVKSTIENDMLQLGYSTSGADTVKTQLWEVLNMTPILSNEKEFEYKPASELPTLIKIRVSVFTEKGCRVTQEATQENEQPN